MASLYGSDTHPTSRKRTTRSASVAGDDSPLPPQKRRRAEEHDAVPAAPPPKPTSSATCTLSSSPEVQDLITQPSALLSLPPEIRNTIWELTLAHNDKICVTPTLQHPALISTCRQTRSETKKLYFAANRFTLYMRDLDATLLLKWCESVDEITGNRQSSQLTKIKLLSSRNFDNLIQWCHWIHEGRSLRTIYPKDPKESLRRTRAVAIAALRLTETCRKTSWEQCELLLQNLRVACAAYDSLWGKE